VLLSDRFHDVTFETLLLRLPESDLVRSILAQVICAAVSRSIPLNFLLLFTHTFAPVLLRICQRASETATDGVLEPLVRFTTKLTCFSSPSFTLAGLSDLFSSTPAPIEVCAPSPAFLDAIDGLFGRLSEPPGDLSLYKTVRVHLGDRFSAILDGWGIADADSVPVPSTPLLSLPRLLSAPVFCVSLQCMRDRSAYTLTRALWRRRTAQYFDRWFRPAFAADADPTRLVDSSSEFASRVNRLTVLCQADDDGVIMGGLWIAW
jgi:hypothetical protein